MLITKDPQPRIDQANQRTRQLHPAYVLALIILPLGWLLFAQAARAQGSVYPTVSSTPSKTQPYTPCPPGGPTKLQCNLIIDPPTVHTSTGYSLPEGGPMLAGHGVGGGFSPADLRAAYHIPVSTYRGTGQTVAVIDAYYDASAESDLVKYREHYGLSSCTKSNGCFKQVNQLGEEGNYPTEGNAVWSEETALDMDMVSAACPNCKILVVEAKTEDAGEMAAAVETAARLKATAISNSYGYPEKETEECGSTGCSQYNSAYNQPGIAVTAAGGDFSYAGRGELGPEWPASSPYVIAVGGTALEEGGIGTRGWNEVTWSRTGSGCGVFQFKPSWQLDTGCATRTYNDTAAVAAETTPVSLYDAGEWFNGAGTSASAPLIAGIEAMSGEYAESLGAKAFYIPYEQRKLFDITKGSNGTCSPAYLCTAEIGYDGPTGNGAPVGLILPDEWHLAGVAWPEPLTTTLIKGSKFTFTEPAMETTVQCEDTGKGIAGPGTLGEITKWEASNCTYIKAGLCEGTPTVEPANLPWHSELITTSGKVREMFVNTGAGAPGFKVTCKAFGSKFTDECSGSLTASPTNSTTGVTAAFEATGLKCTLGTNTGKLEGSQKLEAQYGLLSAVNGAEAVKLSEAEWHRGHAPLKEAVATTLTGTIKLAEPELQATVECKDTGSGTVGPGSPGEIKQWKASSCTYVKPGKCEGTPTIEALHLPWRSELAATGTSGVQETIIAGSGGAPDLKLTCKYTGLGKVSIECLGAFAASMHNELSNVTATLNETERRSCNGESVWAGSPGTLGGSQKITATGGGELEAVS